jgi:hypothetical protein
MRNILIAGLVTSLLLAQNAPAQSTPPAVVPGRDTVLYENGGQFVTQRLLVSHNKLQRGTEFLLLYSITPCFEFGANGNVDPASSAIAPELAVTSDTRLLIQVSSRVDPKSLASPTDHKCPQYLIKVRAPRDLPLGLLDLHFRLTWQPRVEGRLLDRQSTEFDLPIEVVAKGDTSAARSTDFPQIPSSRKWVKPLEVAAVIILFPFYIVLCIIRGDCTC